LTLEVVAWREQEEQQKWIGGRLSPTAYKPKWMGQTLPVTGTSSRVVVKSTGIPQWLTVYFKESPDTSLVVCSPYPDMFEEKAGGDLSALVGKTLEVAGPVEG
jgi:hypothetical protein